MTTSLIQQWRQALPLAVRKMSPRALIDTPVMLVVWVGAALTTVACFVTPSVFAVSITLWLWGTVFLATMTEAVAEGRGRAQAAALRTLREDLSARRIEDGAETVVPASELRAGDIVRVSAGQVIPADGDVVAGAATVDESAVTGESAPVIRESGGDRSAVTGGTRVLSDEIDVRVTAASGDSFVDRMIALVEGAERTRTPNEIALGILLSALTLVFLVVVALLPAMSRGAGADEIPFVTLVALLVCLIPTTIGALLPAIGIAGMNRLLAKNVLATSGRAVEAAGDVDVLLLDKTGTITLGDRQARRLIAASDQREEDLARAARLASLGDHTPEGRSLVALVDTLVGDSAIAPPTAIVVPFSANTRMSGIDVPGPAGMSVRKGAASAVRAWVGGALPADVDDAVRRVSSEGATALVVARRLADHPVEVMGVVALEDIVKEGLPARFAEVRAMGIATVMATGDNLLTAQAIGREAGIDDVLAEATPEDKIARIRQEQSAGRLVAMTGDGTNDAPALAQADVGVAMNSGTAAAKEAASMVDLDSDPSKLIDIVDVGKRLLVTRGALTTFSIANDVAKYFAILPALFAASIPGLASLNIMGLATPESAVLSAVIFNALVIVALVPLALRGARFRPASADVLLRRNLLTYGIGGLIAPFVGIALIDLVVRHIPGIGL